MVGEVDRNYNMNWNEILPPPDGTGREHYLTAITRVNDRIVEIYWRRKSLAEISTYDGTISDDVIDKDLLSLAKGLEVLFCRWLFCRSAQMSAYNRLTWV